MARYEHLPIYKKAMELSVYLEGAVANFSRYHKSAIGEELRELAQRCDMLVTMLVLARHFVEDTTATPESPYGLGIPPMLPVARLSLS